MILQIASMLLASVTTTTNNPNYDYLLPFSSSGSNVITIYQDASDEVFYCSVEYDIEGRYFFNKNGVNQVDLDFDIHFVTEREYEDSNGQVPYWGYSWSTSFDINGDDYFTSFDTLFVFDSESDGESCYSSFDVNFYRSTPYSMDDTYTVYQYYEGGQGSRVWLSEMLRVQYPTLLDDLIRARSWYLSTIIGEDNSYLDGYNAGYDAGEANGFSSGYSEGFNDGQREDEDIVSIFNGIVNIGLMPLNMFLGMFNFNILGISMADFVAALVTIACIVIVIKSIVGGSSKK